jgi:hypothetical protein
LAQFFSRALRDRFDDRSATTGAEARIISVHGTRRWKRRSSTVLHGFTFFVSMIFLSTFVGIIMV